MQVDKALLEFAEQILDEMIAAESTPQGDYALFVKHFDTVEDFGPTRFKKELLCIQEDLGKFQRREYLGAIKGYVDPDYPDKKPECIRFNWRGIFEKNETLITLGLHKKDGKFVVNEIMYR